MSKWTNDPDFSPPSFSSSAPIPIPSNSMYGSQPFFSFHDHQSFPQHASFSPAEFALDSPLPDAFSPGEESKPYNGHMSRQANMSEPSWVSQLWDAPASYKAPSATRQLPRHSPLSDRTQRPRVRSGNLHIPLGQMFQSSSAPSVTHTRSVAATRSYSRRADSVSESDDRDATIRRRKTSPIIQDAKTTAADSRMPIF
jgi:hypothetical protein